MEKGDTYAALPATHLAGGLSVMMIDANDHLVAHDACCYYPMSCTIAPIGF
jgi:hypothetical protein